MVPLRISLSFLIINDGEWVNTILGEQLCCFDLWLVWFSIALIN